MTHANHRAKQITRRTKALTLIPATLASGALTALVMTSTGASAPLTVASPLPGSTTVPEQALQTQATISQVGEIAPAVPAQAVNAVVASATVSGIPAIALNAYQRAAQVINASDKSCHMPWQLIGAIGRVESNHGQIDGNHLDINGNARPGIYGPALDGNNGLALVKDTDGGALDHDTTYDRAVGPMQFLPSTWSLVAVDANGDGKRDPQNIYDASLGSAVYLCSGTGNMTDPASLRSAVLRYNHSAAYADLVIRVMKAYQAGNYTTIPTGTVQADGPLSSTSTADSSPSAKAARSASASSSPSGQASSAGSPSASASPSPDAPMTAAQANAYCQKRLGLVNGILMGQQCTKKLTGMTPAQADSGWAAHQNNLSGWFNS